MSEKMFGRVFQFFAFVGVFLLGMSAYQRSEAAIYYVPDPDNYGSVKACDNAGGSDPCSGWPGGYNRNEATAATEYVVPRDYPTVQACIDAAQNGDTCLVEPGTYHENIVLNDKTVTIQSIEGPLNTILDGNYTGSVLKLSDSVAPDDAVVLDGFTVTHGLAADLGGGISTVSIDTTLRNCVITDNSAPAGGGISFDHSYVRIENCTISGNHSTDPSKGGGGIYSYWDLVTTINSTISGNKASGNGGGISTRWSVWVDNWSTITDNVANLLGGGVFCEDYYYYVNTGLIARNTASVGGGFYAGDGYLKQVEIVNATITGNTAGEGGGVFYGPSSGNFILLNSIVYGNTTHPVFQLANSCSSIAFSDIEGGFAGDGNINLDPLFVNAAGGDYHLQSLSPCVNAGTSAKLAYCSAGIDPSSLDIEGTARPQGPAYDMGAYEYIPLITASAGPNGTISPTGNVVVTYGTDQTFTMTPNNGYRVSDVLVDDVSVGAITTYTFTNVTTNHTISASFVRPGKGRK